MKLVEGGKKTGKPRRVGKENWTSLNAALATEEDVLCVKPTKRVQRIQTAGVVVREHKVHHFEVTKDGLSSMGSVGTSRQSYQSLRDDCSNNSR